MGQGKRQFDRNEALGSGGRWFAASLSGDARSQSKQPGEIDQNSIRPGLGSAFRRESAPSFAGALSTLVTLSSSAGYAFSQGSGRVQASSSPGEIWRAPLFPATAPSAKRRKSRCQPRHFPGLGSRKISRTKKTAFFWANASSRKQFEWNLDRYGLSLSYEPLASRGCRKREDRRGRSCHVCSFKCW